MSLEWMARAICVGEDPELFFPDHRGRPTQRSAEQVAQAKAVCANCPVLEQCREWAVTSLPFGIAGGMTEQERHAVRVARRRAVA